MKLDKELREFGKSKIQQWRAAMDELEVQLALGKAEAKDTLKREKKNISAFIQKQKAQTMKEEKAKLEQCQKLKKELEGLFLAMDDPMDKSKKSYEQKKKVILNKLYQLESEIKQNQVLYNSWWKMGLEDLKKKMDNFRIDFALSSFETLDTFAASKKELMEVLQKVVQDLNKMLYPEAERINVFMDEISESFEHLKKAFSNVLN